MNDKPAGWLPEARERMDSEGDADQPIGPSWPDPLAPEAYHGIVGEWICLIEPETEADPAALLIQMLVALGNLIGRGPHFCAEADRHYTVLYAVIVGRTSKARKGTSEGRVRSLLGLVDAEYARRRIKSGLSTGEGLVYEIRDATASKIPDPGEPDKRLLAIEPEMASVHQACERLGNTLSATLRRNWDSPPLLAPMTKTNRCEATNPHISVIGHITKDELRRLMTDVAMANGWANRFLWCCACRSKSLPEGGALIRATLRRDKALKLPLPPSPGRPYSAEEKARMLEEAQKLRTPQMHAALALDLNTGLRDKELREIRWEQIDLIHKKALTVGRSKTEAGTGRVIPLNETAIAALEAHAAWYTRRFGACRPEWFVFAFGTPLPKDPTRPITSFKTAWIKVRQKAGVKGRWHDNRHTLVTELAESGAGDEVIMSIAGHVSRAMLSRYSHVRMEAKRRALDEIAVRQRVADRADAALERVRDHRRLDAKEQEPHN